MMVIDGDDIQIHMPSKIKVQILFFLSKLMGGVAQWNRIH
jgi:isopentenyl phosphate kinase